MENERSRELCQRIRSKLSPEAIWVCGIRSINTFLSKISIAKGLRDQIVKIGREFLKIVGQQNYGDNKHIHGCLGWNVKNNRQRTENF